MSKGIQQISNGMQHSSKEVLQIGLSIGMQQLSKGMHQISNGMQHLSKGM